jgi:hypothetical protein
MPICSRTDDWREERAAILHSLALAAASAGDDATVEVSSTSAFAQHVCVSAALVQYTIST